MIAILSDVHGNLPALEAVLEDALIHGCDRFISLGDIVGYYAQPGECIDLLRKYEATNIFGNHDNYLVSNTNCSRSRLVAAIMNYQKTIVNDEQISWLSKSHSIYREGRCLYTHGGPDDPKDQYLYTITEEIFAEDIDVLFSGHTHVQMFIRFENKVYCNPGSVGQPRDGDHRAAYAIIDSDKIILHRVSYDIDKTVFAMKNAGFEAFYYENLYIGAQIGGRIDKIKVKKERW